MAKKKKDQDRKVDTPPQSRPEQVIIIHFTRGVPKMETDGDLQVWHFMTATALLQQVILQDVLLSTFQQASARETAKRQGLVVAR